MNRSSGLSGAVASDGETGKVTEGRGHVPTPGTEGAATVEDSAAFLVCVRFAGCGAALFGRRLRFAGCCVEVEADGAVAGSTVGGLFLLARSGGGGKGGGGAA